MTCHCTCPDKPELCGHFWLGADQPHNEEIRNECPRACSWCGESSEDHSLYFKPRKRKDVDGKEEWPE